MSICPFIFFFSFPHVGSRWPWTGPHQAFRCSSQAQLSLLHFEGETCIEHKLSWLLIAVICLSVICLPVRLSSVYHWGGTRATVPMWKSENNFWGLVLSFCSENPRVELWPSVLMTRTLTHCAISLALRFLTKWAKYAWIWIALFRWYHSILADIEWHTVVFSIIWWCAEHSSGSF